MTETSLSQKELEERARRALAGIPDAPKSVGATTPTALEQQAAAALQSLPDTESKQASPGFRIDPLAARMAGGLAGGAIGAPLGPLGILGGGALGAELAGQGAELLNQFVFGEDITETPGGRTSRAALNIGTDIVMTAGGGKLGGLAQKGFGRVIRGRGTETAIDTLRRFDQAGVPVEGAAGAVTRNRVTQGIQSALRKSPGGAQIIQDGIDKTMDGFQSSFARTANKLGGADAFETAGESLQTGIKGWVRTSGEVLGKQYESLKGLSDLPVDIRPIKQLAQNILQETGEFLPDKGTQELAQEILRQGDDIPFALARRMRSKLLAVGRQGDAMVAGEAQSAGKRLSGEMDRAMEVSAAKGLQGESFSRFRGINDSWRQRAETIDLLEGIAKSPTAEGAFRLAVSGANKGPTMLKALRGTIDPALWDDVVAVKLRDMALETKGQGITAAKQFSPTKFLSNWRDLTTSSKDVLFPKGAPLRRELDNLVEVSGALKDASFMENTSGTGGNFFFMSVLTTGAIGAGVGFSRQGSLQDASKGFVTGAAAGVGLFGSTFGAAKLMTNPGFVRFLADGSKIRADNFRGISAHIGKLLAFARQNPDLADAITDYVGFARIFLDSLQPSGL